MLRRAYEAQNPEHPELVTYVAAIQWPDGTTKQAHFVFDEDKYAEMEVVQGQNCPPREHVVLSTMAQMIEGIFTKRRDERRGRLIVPGK